MLITTVKRTIAHHSLFSPGDRVVVAVSGGPDSVCLLAVLRELAPEMGLSLHVAHLDHRFRGEESAADARFVEKLCRDLGVPATIEAIDVPRYCRERGLSSPAGAREVRYAFLDRIALETGAARIAVGHTASDQAETLLMRLLRGAGQQGLSGMPPRRDLIVRPLLEATREEVLAHLGTRGLSFVNDSSNLSPDYTRNRVRIELLPLLKRFNPRIEETLAAEAALLRDENTAVEAYVASIAEDIVHSDGEAQSVRRDLFDPLPPAFRRRLLRMAAERAGLPASSLSLLRVDDALAFMASSQTGRSMQLAPGITITREYGRFLLAADAGTQEFSVTLAVPGRTLLADQGLAVDLRLTDAPELPETGENYRWQATFDYAKMTAPLYVRSRRSGDRFCPAGMGGRHKKLQDFFVDEKVPQRLRNTVPLLATEEDIVWVMGMRTDERFLPSAGTGRLLTVTVRDGIGDGARGRPQTREDHHRER